MSYLTLGVISGPLTYKSGLPIFFGMNAKTYTGQTAIVVFFPLNRLIIGHLYLFLTRHVSWSVSPTGFKTVGGTLHDKTVPLYTTVDLK
mgnify:FL=1